MPKVAAIDVNREQIALVYDEKPDTCPLCHHAGEAQGPLFASIDHAAKNIYGSRLEIVYRCPRRRCASLYIGRYRSGVRGPSNKFELRNVAPSAFEGTEQPEEIASVSPAFVELFQQAETAEHFSLDDIAGVGYRKALEFLIKDYCCTRAPTEVDDIRQEPLGRCIESRVEDANVKACAHRAAWLGNDETHYERRWENRDIADLKTLIQLTVGWIRNSVLTEAYFREMPDGGTTSDVA